MPARAMGACALATVSLFAPAAADAHGRPPQMLSVNFSPAAPEVMLAGTTFGAVVSADAGESWRWICHEAIGSRGLVDPVFAYTSRGTLFATTEERLRVSRDGGCSWKDIPLADDVAPTDVVVVARPGAEIIYVTTSRSDRRNGILRSSDDGETFQVSGGLVREGMLFSSLRAAPGAPDVLYAAAWWYDPLASWLFRSDDGGASWRTIEQPDARAPFSILGVSPATPELLLAQVDATRPGAAPEHRVLRSADGGRSFSVVLTSSAPVRSFSFSADGARAWLATVDGVLRSTDAARSFAKLPLPAHHPCVSARGASLFACGSTYDEGWALAHSADGGDSWTGLMRFDRISGVLTCSRGTTTAGCSSHWPALADLFGIAPAPPTAAPDAGPPARPAATETGMRSGGCSFTGGRSRPGALPLLALLAAWDLRPRASRRRTRD